MANVLVSRTSPARLLRTLFVFIAVSIGAGLATVPAHALFTEQDKLIGSGAVGAALQGASVALSADGNTALVGGDFDNSDTGAAWVFTRDSNGAWTQQGNKLVGTGAVGTARQGVSVALSADGNTAMVGGVGDNSFLGAAWVFTRDSNGVWTQQGNKLVGTGAVANAQQGISVALSADGNTALVGGNFDNSLVGATWVFTRDGSGVWTQQGNKLVGTGAVGDAQQGRSVALSADGNTAVIGGWIDNSFVGAAWVFTRDSNGAWTQQGNKLTGTDAVGTAQQGISVALSADGNTALVGGNLDNSDTGAAWVFTRDGSGVWTQQGNKLIGAGAVGTARQGRSVALSADGDTAVVGGAIDNGEAGAAWIFRRSRAGVWFQRGNKLVGSGAVGNARQGTSVALSGDGNTAIVGGPADNSQAGAAWVFGRPGITSIDPTAGTVDGGTVVTISGTNFFDVTGVLFGGVAATNVTEVDANTIEATTPAHAGGPVSVRVTTTTGANLARAAYTYERHVTVTQLSSSVNPSSVGQSVTFTATVTANGGPASGSVTFMSGTQTLGTVGLSGGAAQLSTDVLTAGRHSIKAIFLKNGNFDGSIDRLRQRVR